MDGRGRLAQPLTWIAQWRAGHAVTTRLAATAHGETARVPPRGGSCSAGPCCSRYAAAARRAASTALRRHRAASLGYGIVKGDHVPTVIDGAARMRATASPTRPASASPSIALSGNHHVSREEVLAIAGITGRTSLLFLDVEQARERLKTNPVDRRRDRAQALSRRAADRASRSARPSRSGRRTARCRSSPTTAPCSSPTSRPA